jgi:hypothetical protein
MRHGTEGVGRNRTCGAAARALEHAERLDAASLFHNLKVLLIAGIIAGHAGVKATPLWPDHSETSRTLQRAATRMATKLCRRPWKVRPSRPARVNGRAPRLPSEGRAEQWSTAPDERGRTALTGLQ